MARESASRNNPCQCQEAVCNENHAKRTAPAIERNQPAHNTIVPQPVQPKPVAKPAPQAAAKPQTSTTSSSSSSQGGGTAQSAAKPAAQSQSVSNSSSSSQEGSVQSASSPSTAKPAARTQ